MFANTDTNYYLFIYGYCTLTFGVTCENKTSYKEHPKTGNYVYMCMPPPHPSPSPK